MSNWSYNPETDMTTVRGFHGTSSVVVGGKPQPWNDLYVAVPLAPCEEVALREALECRGSDCVCGGGTGADVARDRQGVPIALGREMKETTSEIIIDAYRVEGCPVKELDGVYLPSKDHGLFQPRDRVAGYWQYGGDGLLGVDARITLRRRHGGCFFERPVGATAWVDHAHPRTATPMTLTAIRLRCVRESD